MYMMSILKHSEAKMGELKDYSGEFTPNLKYEDFSKDFLIKVMREWTAAYLRQAEFWFQTIEEQGGQKLACNCEAATWHKMGAITVPKVAKALGIKINDILDALKIWQLLPDGPLTGIIPVKYDIKNRNHIIMTVTKCGSLEFFERRGQTDRIAWMCEKLELPTITSYLTSLLPNAEVRALKLPPRKSADEIPCVWEFKLRPVT
jgi:hypothetical protein